MKDYMDPESIKILNDTEVACEITQRHLSNLFLLKVVSNNSNVPVKTLFQSLLFKIWNTYNKES